jgi:D-lactate dehydrogenase
MRVAVFETQEWEHEACRRLQIGITVTCRQDALDSNTTSLDGETEIISPFVNSRLTSEVLSRFPRLRLIATRSTGYDHIDLAYCSAHGVTVCNVPDYGDTTVAEHSFALLLALSRHIVDAVERTRRGSFTRENLRGFDLFGRTLGVIGTGRIGRRVIAIARGFGMSVVGFDARRDMDAASRHGFDYVAMDELLARSDVVTLHIPATAGAAPLIGDRELGLMKPGAILINTARGSLVDVPALIRALKSGRLGGAGLDVLPQEPLLRDEAEVFRTDALSAPEVRNLLASNVLLQFPNVVVTPHNAYNTRDAVHRIIETTIDNIEAYLRGEPVNVVSPRPA